VTALRFILCNACPIKVSVPTPSVEAAAMAAAAGEAVTNLMAAVKTMTDQHR